MKQTRMFGALLLVVILFCLAACSQKETVSQPTNEPPAQLSPTTSTTSGDTQASSTAVVDGEALILEKLQNHHGIDRVYGAKHTREEWNATLDRMNSYGANISEEEKKAIIDYLLSR